MRSLTENERQHLREGIQRQYKQYQLKNPVRFPDFDYNTNRANYEPLRTSFEVEFYETRGIDRLSDSIHIPSTSTLAMLFTDPTYVPNKKIVNTCLSYAEGPIARIQAPEPTDPVTASPASRPPAHQSRNFLLIGVSITLVGVLFFCIRLFFIVRPSGLRMDRPVNHTSVSQEVIVEGQAIHTETVWLVVHPESGHLYYVQPAVKVQDNNWWISVVFVGGTQNDDVGHTFQIRAFVHPVQPLTSGQILHSWPEAALSTPAATVTRKANEPQ